MSVLVSGRPSPGIGFGTVGYVQEFIISFMYIPIINKSITIRNPNRKKPKSEYLKRFNENILVTLIGRFQTLFQKLEEFRYKVV